MEKLRNALWRWGIRLAGVLLIPGVAVLSYPRWSGLMKPVEITATVQSDTRAALPEESTPVSATTPSEPATQTTQTTPTTQPTQPPKNDGTGGSILEQTVGGGTAADGIRYKNRSGTLLDIPSALSRPLVQTFTDTAEPQVLILHTHTTEQYMTYDAGYYNNGDRARKTTNPEKTVVAAGEALKEELASYGIAAVHDTTVHDSPQYTGAYTRSAETAENLLARYPTVKVVLDLHRDAIMGSGDTLIKPTVTVDGQKAAQMMIIAGVVSTQGLPHPHWEDNFAFAVQWQKAISAAYPQLMRPMSVVASRYNQHLSTGYLLVEVGSEGNTVAEAEYSARLLGKTMVQLLKGEKARG